MSPGIVIRRFDQLHGAGVIAGDLVETRSHDLSDGLIGDRAVQESGDGDFIGGVQHRRSRSPAATASRPAANHHYVPFRVRCPEGSQE